MQVPCMGGDVAKQVFQVHGGDRHGTVVLRQQLIRGKMRGVCAQLPLCRIGIEVCARAHDWAREWSPFGHTVRLITPQLVRSSRKNPKHDGNAAAASCTAVSRPHLRVVPVQWGAQRAVLTVHRASALVGGNRTALGHQLRGWLVA